MRSFIHAPVALALSMLSPACDDMTESDTDADLESEADEDAGDDAGFGFGEVKPRCTPPPCIDPPVSNTNWVGTSPVDTVTHETWNVPTRLANGKWMRIVSASCPLHSYVYKFNATPKGELVFYRSSTGGESDANKTRGTAVQGCKFQAQFSDTSSFATFTSSEIRISQVEPVLRADNTTHGFEYLMIANGVPGQNDTFSPTCQDSLAAPGNHFLTVRPGLALNRGSWHMYADPTKQSWVCAAGAAGHFTLRDVDVEDISDPALATAEMRAWGLYHHNAPHTYVGNPIKIRYNGPAAIEGYNDAPDNCNDAEDWYTEARYANGSLVCRGSNATAWSSQINRNAWSHFQDWDDDSNVALVPVCTGAEAYQFETYARCYMNGTIQVCPPTSGC